jgi:hypothetical protein
MISGISLLPPHFNLGVILVATIGQNPRDAGFEICRSTFAMPTSLKVQAVTDSLKAVIRSASAGGNHLVPNVPFQHLLVFRACRTFRTAF